METLKRKTEKRLKSQIQILKEQEKLHKGQTRSFSSKLQEHNDRGEHCLQAAKIESLADEIILQADKTVLRMELSKKDTITYK